MHAFSLHLISSFAASYINIKRIAIVFECQISPNGMTQSLFEPNSAIVHHNFEFNLIINQRIGKRILPTISTVVDYLMHIVVNRK